MTSVTKILDEIEGTQGTNAKIAILERESSNELLKRAIFAATDPYATYFVSKFKVAPSKYVDEDATDENEDECLKHFIDDTLKDLQERKVTGNAAKALVESAFAIMTPREQKWCQRLILRKLRIGIQESSLDKVWPGLVKSFSVSLAETLKSDFVKGEGIKILQPVKYPVRVEPKLDGLRCVAVKMNGEVTFYTRNGTVLETVPTIKAALENAPYDNVVLDGELLANGTWNDTVSIVMSSKKQKDDTNLIFNVFDCVIADNWVTQEDNVPYEERLVLASTVVESIASDKVTTVAHIVAKDETELKAYFKKCMDEGFEGVMLKTITSPYLFKRSANILKLKPVVTYEGAIVGTYEGRRGTKREGLFGGFNVILPNGIITRVGGGFTDAVRADIALAGEDSFLGKIMEIEAQPDPLTKDGLSVDGKARFPVFIRFRSEADVDPKVVAAAVEYFEKDDE